MQDFFVSVHSRNSIPVPCQSNPKNTAVLHLSRPAHNFHGNHWFHVGEHYISRHDQIAQMLGMGNSSLPLRYKHIKVVASNNLLTIVMNRFSFSLLVLSIYHPGVESIELFHPVYEFDKLLPPKDANNCSVNNSSICFAPHARKDGVLGPMLGYYASRPPLERFVNYTSVTAWDRRRVHKCGMIDDMIVHVDQWIRTARKLLIHWLGMDRIRMEQPLSGEHIAGLVGQERQGGQGHQRGQGGQGGQGGQETGCDGNNLVCGVYVGQVGESQLPTDVWFGDQGAADGWRGNARHMCAPRTVSGGETEGEIGHRARSGAIAGVGTIEVGMWAERRVEMSMVVYQRNVDRKIADITLVLEAIEQRNGLLRQNYQEAKLSQEKGDVVPTLVQWRVTMITHDEGALPCPMYEQLFKADMLLTAHGFQCTALTMLKPGAALMEIFPYKYYKRSYVFMSQHFRLRHICAKNPSLTTALGSDTLGPGLFVDTDIWTDLNNSDSETRTRKTDAKDVEWQKARPQFKNLRQSPYSIGLAERLLDLVTQEDCMKNMRCRSYARGRNVGFTRRHMQMTLDTMVALERDVLLAVVPPTTQYWIDND
ncbi:hypothetical protein B484DRAFT_435051 [Ochromonadaceae sp. CCMP2298]|nr:hypothetical protein B484DRAFT_435051 [Ochromonadaceae sp. CCMP2298]